MRCINLLENKEYLNDYVILCSLEWGTGNITDEQISDKINKILNGDKVISVLGIVEEELIGFISLFKYDGDERRDLTPWYATMYVKSNYRGKGYSKLLNEMIINEAKRLGYEKIYLKSDLINYYEKFGAVYIEDLDCGEKLYYISLGE